MLLLSFAKMLPAEIWWSDLVYPHRPTFSITMVDVKHTYCRYWPTRHVNESVSSTARRRERAGELGSSAAESGAARAR